MASIFISHSSRDDAIASQLEKWLHLEGFSDLFIDHSSISGGEAWADALRANAGSCRVVLCLVTPDWLASPECSSEFKAAWYMGKRIIPLFLLGDEAALNGEQIRELSRVRAEAQGIDLTPFLTATGLDFARDETRADVLKKGLREAGALAAVGLDPAAFEIDHSLRPSPFPGLTSFADDDADAALFFGRAREIAETLEDLRKMRAESDKRPFVILGASGSGKSSLLKAGIIPRLRREAPAWLPLRAFRPGADPLLNFAEAITRTSADFGAPGAHGTLKQTLLSAWQAAEKSSDGELTEEGVQALSAVLDEQAQHLRSLANRPNASLLISVDQAEELTRSDGASGQALADYLRVALNTGNDWQIAFTIRTDSFPELQSHPRFADLKARGYDLRTLPVFRFDDVAEDPAARYGVQVDPALTDALMEDAPGRDALPLLAFALQRLWDQFALSGKLQLADYTAMGGLSGLIEDAAERALCGIEPEQRDTALPSGGAKKHQTERGAHIFVPALADINDEGATIRRVANWTDFDEPEQEMLDRFDRWRLVVRKESDAKGGTVEVAHEALFREWSRLADWLEPQRARLEALRGVKLAAASWDKNNRDKAYLTHFDDRLSQAEELTKIDRYSEQLDGVDLEYIAKAKAAAAQFRRAKRLINGTAILLGLSIVVGSLAYAFEFELRREWSRQFDYARHALDEGAISRLGPGNTFRECASDGFCPEMVVVPAGEFDRGSPETEVGRFGNEGPVRRVNISDAFAVGKFEITHDEWAKCVSLTDQSANLSENSIGPKTGCAPLSDSGFGKGNNPAINLNWHDAQGYVRWLNHMITGDAENGPYRLLTEAEWEYAARAGTQSAYSWGDDADDICSYANLANPDTKTKYGFSRDVVDCSNNYLETSPVGTFEANAFGLYDMHGNVWEWTEDCWNDSYTGAPEDGSAWLSGDCSARVQRGGAWDRDPYRLRSAYRGRINSTHRNYIIGFRIARTL